MRRCVVCKRRLRIDRLFRYEVTESTGVIGALTQGTKIYEAFDCEFCGCQNIVNIRLPKITTKREQHE